MDEGIWRIKTDASLQTVLEDPACPPLLLKVLSISPSWQFRNATTLERTLASSRLMPHWTAALLALDAAVTIEGDDGSEQVPLEALVRERRKGRMTSLQVQRRDNARWGDAHVARTPSDVPIVGAYAVVWAADGVVEDARVALCGASSVPVWVVDAVELLVGHPLDEERIGKAASAVLEEVEPTGDYLGSEAYRRAMAGILTRRALEGCMEQEEGDE